MQYRMLRIITGFLCSIVFLHATDLETEKRLHENFWEKVITDYEVETKTQANSRSRVLTELQIFEGRRSIDGTINLTIAKALAPYVRNFSYLEIKGENLDLITSVAYKVTGGTVYTNPQLQTQRLIQIPSSLFADWAEEPQTLILEGTAVITAVRLISLEGLSSTFDESLFNIADSSEPPMDAVLQVDPSRTLSIEGVSELPTDRFFRLYINPGSDLSGMEDDFAAKGFYPGRQMLKLAHELETRHGAYTEPLLQEDPDRTGYADLSIFKQRTFDQFWMTDPELKFAQCFNIWPSFMDAQIPGQKNTLGTPAIDAFDAAAELAAAYVADEIEDSGRTATYWEVKNESDIQHEWTYHLLPQFDGWGLLGDFHNRVAQALKKVDPTIQVGGPASAWPRMEMGRPSFAVWENHKQFMDLTRADLDFYSHHFYDRGVRSSYAARTEGYDDWLQGRLDCVLDLLCAEMRNSGNVKPLLITEYGTLLGGTREIDYWLRVSNYSSFMLQFMERPADFLLTVPFLLGYMHWEPDSGFALVKRNALGDYELSKNAYFMDLWEGVSGEYLSIDPIHPRVHSLAWKKEQQIFIAVNNQSGRSLKLRPELILPRNNRIQSIRYRLPTYQNGRFQLRRDHLAIGASLSIGNAETAVIIIETAAPTATSAQILETAFYGQQTILSLGERPTVTIETPAQNISRLQSVTLRLGLEDKDGPSGTLRGQFNGHPFKVDLDAYQSLKNFFEYVDVTIPVNQLQDVNKITLSLKNYSTILSHAKLTIRALLAE
jgi:agarase